MSKYDIIQIIFKCCVSQMFLIVLLPNLISMYDLIALIEKINYISLSRIGPIPTIDKWFLIHTIELERRRHLGTEQVM